MRWIAVACLIGLLSACASVGVDHPQHASALTSARPGQSHATASPADSSYCPAPTTTVFSGTKRWTVPPDGPLRITVLVGDQFLVRTTGTCARSVNGPGATGACCLRVLDREHHPFAQSTVLDAWQPGVDTLMLDMGMCALPPGVTPTTLCIGGVRLAGTIVVTVKDLGVPS